MSNQPAAEGAPNQVVELRPFGPDDLKEVRLLLGYSAMEQLARANQLTYQNPLVLAAWFAVSAIMIQIMGWWPQPRPYWTWLMPLPALAACAAPFLFGVDWFNRTPFERLLRHSLSREDIMDIPQYYSQAPGSGFFVLAYKGVPIGVCAIDSVRPGEELGGAPEEIVREDGGEKAVASKIKELKEKGNPAPKVKGKGKGKDKENDGPQLASEGLVRIRHFHIDAPYRPTNISRDLLSHVLQYSFAVPTTQYIYARISPLSTDKRKELEEVGFVRVREVDVPSGWEAEGEKRGLGGWREGWFRVGRAEWERKRKEIEELVEGSW